MRRSTASELRMLREITWHYGTTHKCFFCKKPLLDPGANDLEFGERMFPPVKVRLAIHHENGDHSDNSKKNRGPAHSKCHKQYHIKLLHASGALKEGKRRKRNARA